MGNFTTLFSNIIVASTNNCLTVTNGFKNINGIELLTNIKRPCVGNKDGSHFLRCKLFVDSQSVCLSRSDNNAVSLASIVILDCDKRIDINGEELEGAPDPKKISQILTEYNVGHVLYGSYSHYVGNKGNRYRILILTNKPYTKEQLPNTMETIISLINSKLDGALLANAKENNTWSQPWYYPRKPADSIVDDLYYEYLEGTTIEVIEPYILPAINKNTNTSTIKSTSNNEMSVIQVFNDQNPIVDILSRYGYKKIYNSKEYDKWLSPNSTSGVPGITVKDNKLFSHHNDQFNDGYWHDAFDLYKGIEGLTDSGAIKKIAKIISAHDGRPVDEYNKSISLKGLEITNNDSTLSQHIAHVEILGKLMDKIKPVDFRVIANITEPEEKLKLKHFYVITVQQILELAKKHNWGICRNHDFIYVYNGAYWSLVENDVLHKFLGEAAERFGVPIYTARDYEFRKKLYNQFISVAHLPRPIEPKGVVYINLKNGTFEITPTGNGLRPFDRDNFITYQLGFDYNPNATAPLFQEYLNKVLPDKNLQNILAEYLGYVFIGTSTLKLEKVLILYGKGGNGKSVFYEIVRRLFGEHNTSEYSLQSLTDSNGYYRAMIANKLVNYASEINGKMQTSIFKQLASGEPIEARLPYGRPMTIDNYARLIFNCNELPKDVEQTEAYYRRFLIIPFDVRIAEKEQDKQLASKIIETELSGIFNWVLDGLNRLIKQKNFSDSLVVRQIREQYEKESDSVRLFIDEEGYQNNVNEYILLNDIYPEYRIFCSKNGFMPVKRTNFTDRLKGYGIIFDRNNKVVIVYVAKDRIIENAYSSASNW